MIQPMKVDGRKLSHAQLEEVRFKAVKAVQAGRSPTAVARELGLYPTRIFGWLAAYRSGGWVASESLRKFREDEPARYHRVRRNANDAPAENVDDDVEIEVGPFGWSHQLGDIPGPDPSFALRDAGQGREQGYFKRAVAQILVVKRSQHGSPLRTISTPFGASLESWSLHRPDCRNEYGLRSRQNGQGQCQRR
jgi:hypothetical protein